jgi:hypothetical protein
MSKYKKLLNISCRICETNFTTGKQLSNHVLKTHDISSKNYTVSYIYNNIKPLCVICGQETRYVAFTYKRYCKAHCKNAEIEAGKIVRYDRFKYRAQHQTSEKLFALNANVSRIYGCGSYIMKLEF